MNGYPKLQKPIAEITIAGYTYPVYTISQVHAAINEDRKKNEWKEAVLDALSVTCKDFPVDTPPSVIITSIIEWHVQVATDPKLQKTTQLRCPDCGKQDCIARSCVVMQDIQQWAKDLLTKPL